MSVTVADMVPLALVVSLTPTSRVWTVVSPIVVVSDTGVTTGRSLTV